MASLLSNWLRGEPADAPSPALAQALGSLERLGLERPELAGPARMLSRLLAIAFALHEATSAQDFDKATLLDGWRQGEPAFRIVRPGLDADRVRKVAIELVQALADENEKARSLLGALREARIDALACFEEVVQSGPDALLPIAQHADVPPEMLAAVLRLAVLPALESQSIALDPMRPEGLWTRGECPHCGVLAWLAESRGIEQRRYLRCTWCAADWPADRLRCFACSQSDHRLLHNWSVAGQESRSKLVTCDGCGARLKVVATLSALSAPALVVAELETIPLDLIAPE